MADYECLHIEADTILLYVVLDAEDTDVVVLSAYVSHKIDGTLAIMRKHKLINCSTLCPNDISDILIPLHACTQWM